MTTKEVLQYVLENGGITLDYPFNQLRKIDHTTGYLVSMREFGEALHIRGLCIHTINEYILKNKTVLEHDGNKFFGIWIDNETSIVYLDVSIHIQELEPALNFAKINRQLAIWDCANKTEVKV